MNVCMCFVRRGGVKVGGVHLPLFVALSVGKLEAGLNLL